MEIDTNPELRNVLAQHEEAIVDLGDISITLACILSFSRGLAESDSFSVPEAGAIFRFWQAYAKQDPPDGAVTRLMVTYAKSIKPWMKRHDLGDFVRATKLSIALSRDFSKECPYRTPPVVNQSIVSMNLEDRLAHHDAALRYDVDLVLLNRDKDAEDFLQVLRGHYGVAEVASILALRRTCLDSFQAVQAAFDQLQMDKIVSIRQHGRCRIGRRIVSYEINSQHGLVVGFLPHFDTQLGSRLAVVARCAEFFAPQSELVPQYVPFYSWSLAEFPPPIQVVHSSDSISFKKSLIAGVKSVTNMMVKPMKHNQDHVAAAKKENHGPQADRMDWDACSE